MGQFTFRLQSVLDLNTRKKQSAASRFAVAMRTLESYQREVNSNNIELNRLSKSRFEASDVQRADHIQVIRVRMSKCHNDIAAGLANIKDHLSVIEEKREELVLARREEKKLEMLKTRHYTAWQRDHNRKDQKRLDEAAGIGRYQASRENPT